MFPRLVRKIPIFENIYKKNGRDSKIRGVMIEVLIFGVICFQCEASWICRSCKSDVTSPAKPDLVSSSISKETEMTRSDDPSDDTSDEQMSPSEMVRAAQIENMYYLLDELKEINKLEPDDHNMDLARFATQLISESLNQVLNSVDIKDDLYADHLYEAGEIAKQSNNILQAMLEWAETSRRVSGTAHTVEYI